jgi:hypothetical protein
LEYFTCTVAAGAFGFDHFGSGETLPAGTLFRMWGIVSGHRIGKPFRISGEGIVTADRRPPASATA